MKQFFHYTLLIAFLVVNLSFSKQLAAAPKIVLWNGHQHTNYVAKLADEFQRLYGVEVELHQFFAPKLRDELLTQAMNNQLPDVLYIPNDFVGLYKEINLVPIPAGWMADNVDLRVRNVAKVDDNYYGVPLFQGNHLMLFYNRSLVKKPIASWGELKSQMEGFPDAIQYPITWNYKETYWLIPFMSAFGSRPLDEGKITLNTRQMEQALTFYKKLADDGFVDRGCNHDCSVTRFKEGKSAYLINGDWIIQDLEKEMGDKLGIATLPKVGTKTMLPMFSGYVLAYPNLSEKSNKFEIIKQFTQFAQSKLAQQIIRDQAGLIPVNNEVLAEKTQESTKEKTENKEAIREQMRLTQTLPASRDMMIAWSAMAKGLTRFIDHNYTAKKSTQLMQQIVDRELQRRQRESDNNK